MRQTPGRVSHHSGRMDKRITIFRRVEEQTSTGATDHSPEVFCACWSSLEGLEGKDLFRAVQMQTLTSHVLKIRWRPGVLPSMRIQYQSRSFEIVLPLDVDGDKEWLHLFVLEKT